MPYREAVPLFVSPFSVDRNSIRHITINSRPSRSHLFRCDMGCRMFKTSVQCYTPNPGKHVPDHPADHAAPIRKRGLDCAGATIHLPRNMHSRTMRHAYYDKGAPYLPSEGGHLGRSKPHQDTLLGDKPNCYRARIELKPRPMCPDGLPSSTFSAKGARAKRYV